MDASLPKSLYFDYPQFPFVEPPELRGGKTRHAVTVVGAGPVGLSCALELARHGVSSVVLDPKQSVGVGSRAICIARRSLEILQQLGVSDRFVKKGLGWTNGRSFYKDRLVYELSMPHSEHERFHPMINLQQQYVEKFLVEKACTDTRIDLRWQNTVTALEVCDDTLDVTVSTPAGNYTLASDFVIAADGAHSTIRDAMGLRLAGEAYEGRYVIVDIKMASSHPAERRAFFSPAVNPDSTVLVHKQPDDIWRIDYQLKPTDDSDAELNPDRIRQRVQAVLDMIGEQGPWELEWSSIYKAYTLALDDYRHDRVFFAGHAAHLVPIFGVRGLNSGFADANNLGWKLAYVIRGLASDRLLDSYTPERRAATLDIFESAGKSTRFMTPPSRGFHLMRDAALSLSTHVEFARCLIDPRQSTPYDYTDSPLTSHKSRDSEFDHGPRAGAPLSNRRLPDSSFLLDYLGNGFSGILFKTSEPPAQWFKNLTDAFAIGNEAFTTIVVCREPVKADGMIVLHDPQGEVFTTYDAVDDSFYLVRPDGHICTRWRTLKIDELRLAFAIALGIENGNTSATRKS